MKNEAAQELREELETLEEQPGQEIPGPEVEELTGRVPSHLARERLDRVLAELFPDFSRSRLQEWIRDGRVQVDGKQLRPKDRLLGGEWVELSAELEEQVECRPQPIPLRVVHADRDIFVIDKPAGLVVHPAAGNPEGTLQNGLLNLDPELIRLPRAGIVHRLDKETSGLLVVARTPAAHKSLVAQLQARTIHREYRALVVGQMVAGGTVDAPIGRHPAQRTKMAVVRNGKPAVTHYRVAERFPHHTLLQVNLETGRTHQIRVHLSHIHFPIVGDPAYGGRLRLPAGASPELKAALQGFKRQALHAMKLGLSHPVSGEELAWETPIPADLAELLELLRAEAKRAD